MGAARRRRRRRIIGEVGGGGELAGADVPEIHVGVLPQLRARVLLLAPGDVVHLLLHLAGDSVLQGFEADVALAAQVPVAPGEVELRL